MLGVKVATLYAYASRGLVRSVPGVGARAHRYARADVERLKARSRARSGHGAVAAGALDWGEPVLDTTISSIGPGGPAYRGHGALALASEGRPLEAVAQLLWTGTLPEHPPRSEAVWPRGQPERWAASLPEGAGPLFGPALMLPCLAALDDQRLGASVSSELERARRLMRLLAASFALPDVARARRALEQPTLASALGAAFDHRGTRVARALDAALVLMADHELNASTFAARIAASAGADLYACVSAALATLSGPRHGGASLRVEAFADEVGSPPRAADVVRSRLQRGDPLPGFGHRLYPDGDPRGGYLISAARRLPGRSARLRTLLALADAVRSQGGEPPNSDLGLVALTSALGLPAGAAPAIFALGRCAGWIAHVLEQRADPRLLRPRARYAG
jgi:citrate synthase